MILIFMSAFNISAISSSRVIVPSIGLYAAFVSWFIYTINHYEEDRTPEQQLKYSKIPKIQARFEYHMKRCLGLRSNEVDLYRYVRFTNRDADVQKCIKQAELEMTF